MTVCAWIFLENNTTNEKNKIHSLTLKLINMVLSIKK